MSAPMFRPLLALPLLLASATFAGADDIHLVDGKSIRDCSVTTETFKEVEYREGSRRATVPADQVLRIEYKTMPTLVDRAESAVKDEQVFDAIGDLETYVDGFLSGGKRERYEWAPAYAAHRLIQLHRMVGEGDKAIAAANRLIEKFPQSRYVPFGYIAKANTQAQMGEGAKALQTLKDFQAVVQTQGLSKRWELEGELARIGADASLKGQAKRDALVMLASKAGTAFPTVRNAANVAEAESYLESRNYPQAEKIFQRIVDNPMAGKATLAAAYTGLGECVFQRASSMERGSSEAEKLFKAALLDFMRVVVVTPGETAYVPKAMFFAARIFDLSEDPQAKDNAQKLYRALIRTYDGTPWATEARGFRRRG